MIKLFCVPYAGGSAWAFTKWKTKLHPSIQLVPLELSGRGRRITEPLYEDMESIVDDIYPVIQQEIKSGGPFAIFGHSLGGLVVYELCHRMMETGDPMPVHVFVSGKGAPHRKKEREGLLHLLDDEPFMEEIFKLGGTPREVMENKELFQLVVPVLKSDYRIAEMYVHDSNKKDLPCDLSILYGTEDDIPEEHMSAWRELISGTGTLYPFPGDHFFIHDPETMEEVIDVINSTLKRVLLPHF
ncbi:thioesterase [Kroppenstedtia pulmonis]|uniref:Thioesterase n=1 Tax=Kroppenstedtia pulmonis TaxID=1380685 RepID=A0A7D3Y214_9BACL|nr:alpha/beta fold hydrolase [Kroppenstedtia pulmonis]QKG84603.1 thioesterase [Kroppenstedtia pulmonis]